VNADRLRQAATKIREAANAATPGPWVQFGTSLGNVTDHCNCGGGHAPYGHEYGCGVEGPIIQADEADAAFIALMPPPAALAVADWLDATSYLDDESPEPYVDLIRDRATDVADAILGGES
jgi:hypothetical protein